MAIKHFRTISAYCKGINIPEPKHAHFDIRSFEENMATVHPQMPPFRHEFFAIAIKADGEGKATSGAFTDFPEGAAVFFNTPFQVLSWNIVPNWKGYYIIFSKDFIARSETLHHIVQLFPFLKIDRSVPFTIPRSELRKVLSIYEHIWTEYYGSAKDKFKIIEAQVYLLLSIIKRLFEEQVVPQTGQGSPGIKNLKLLSQYQTLIQTSFQPDTLTKTGLNLHSTAYYAKLLGMHPNYLNSVVKEASGSTALQHIHQHIILLAKSFLAQTDWPIKEIAYRLHFKNPNNFSSFFKKHTNTTPLTYRKYKQS